jgi:hypothetical protein
MVNEEKTMQMKLGGTGIGVGVPRTNLQVSGMNIIKFYFREGAKDSKVKKFGVHDLISIGNKSGAFIFSAFSTKWFDLDPKRDSWARNSHLLIGKKMKISASGIIAKWGSVSVVVKLFDKYNQGKELVNQCCVDVEGGIQFSELKVQGTVVRSAV